MTPKEYTEKALSTESGDYNFLATGEVTPRIEHGVMGIVTEAGELMDAVKKSKIYSKPLDKVNLVEELGDLSWYMAILMDELGVSFEEVWDKNICKLKQRYPEKYSNGHALNRNLEAERKTLEE